MCHREDRERAHIYKHSASRSKREQNIACCPGLNRALSSDTLVLTFIQEPPLLQEGSPDCHPHPQRLCDLLSSKVTRLYCINFH